MTQIEMLLRLIEQQQPRIVRPQLGEARTLALELNADKELVVSLR